MNAPVIATGESRDLLQFKRDVILLNVLPEKFFKLLGGHLVDDVISLNLKLVAR